MSTPSDQIDDITVESPSLAPRGSPGTRQFGRKFSLIVADAAGKGLELGAFRCVFHVQRGDTLTPNSCDVRVYNLNTATANSLAGKEFDQLAIQAGYAGNFGLIFRGNITQSRLGRESQTDSYVDFTAADGDAAYNFSTMSLSLAAGATPRNSVQAFLQSMAVFGVTSGYIDPNTFSNPNGATRGQVFHGTTRNLMREFAATHNVLWSIQDGQLCLLSEYEEIPGAEILITPDTGLVGIPEQTQNGISLRTLLNPSIKIGQAIRLDSSVTINQYRYGLDLQAGVTNPAIALQNQLNRDGLYYVMRADHTGDTRENEWYTDITALSIDATITNLDAGTFPSPVVPTRIQP